MAKFTCAVVGLGNIGLLYDLSHKSGYVLTHTKAYIKHPRYRLLFGIDIDAKRRKLFERYTKLPAFRTLEEAKKVFNNVDIVSICVRLEERMEVLPGAIALKPKVIFMEKPLASDCRQARKIIALCRKNKIALAVNYHRRFEKTVSIIKDLALNKKIGRLLHVSVIYNGGFFNNASHYVDLLLYILGEPVSFYVIRKTAVQKDYDIDFVLSYPYADAYFKSIKTTMPVGELHFWFESGKIEYKKFGNELVYYSAAKDEVFRQFEELSVAKTVKTGLPYVMYGAVDNLYNFLQKKEKLLSDETNALNTLKICEHIAKSN